LIHAGAIKVEEKVVQKIKVFDKKGRFLIKLEDASLINKCRGDKS
jgi:hypothetical protein